MSNAIVNVTALITICTGGFVTVESGNDHVEFHMENGTMIAAVKLDEEGISNLLAGANACGLGVKTRVFGRWFTMK